MPEPGKAEVRVLVVDDQDAVRTYVRRVLGLLGVTDVTEAASGHQALTAVTAPGAQFDLILCDLRMPDGDGVETIHSFGQLGLDSAVAIMSIEDERVLASAGTLVELHGLHLMGVIPKPVTVEKLRPMIDQLRAPSGQATPGSEDIARLDVGGAFDTGELLLYYQPSIQLSDAEPYGIEATVRWRHPRLGLCLPETFVPGLQASAARSHEFTRATLREAVRCAARRSRPGHPARVSVDLALHTVDTPALGEDVAEFCRELGVPPEAITIEVNARQLSHDAIGMLETMTRFRLHGLGIALDAFASTSAVLPNLERLPFNQLRLGHAVVQGCAKSRSQRALIESGITLAHAAQMTVVAVGVERRDDCELLRAAGCDFAQGVYFARPMVEAGLDAWTELWALRRLGD